MELLGTLVGLQRDAPAVDHTACACDPVGIPAYHSAYVAAAGLVPGHVVIPQHHVHRLAVPVRCAQDAQGRAIGEDLGLQPPAAQDELLHSLSAPGHAKGLLNHCHSNLLLVLIFKGAFHYLV